MNTRGELLLYLRTQLTRDDGDEESRMRAVYKLAKRWCNRPVSVTHQWMPNDAEMFAELHRVVKGGDVPRLAGEVEHIQKMIDWVRTNTVDETDPEPQDDFAHSLRRKTQIAESAQQGGIAGTIAAEARSTGTLAASPYIHRVERPRGETANVAYCAVTKREVADCDFCQGRRCAQHDRACGCSGAERHGLHQADAAHVREETDRRMATINAFYCARHARVGPAPIVDQPPPVPTDRIPCWTVVIEHTRRRRNESAYGSTGIVDLVIADMHARDRKGRIEYGVPLTSGNGRAHLVDAYQEALDLAVYLIAELDEYGIDADTYPLAERYDQATAWHIKVVQRTFHDILDTAIRLRALIAAKETPR